MLDHLEVGVKHNETCHFTELLKPLDLAGTVATFDALHTVRANLSWLDFPCARQAIKVTRWRKDTATGRTSRQTAFAVTSLTSADATAQDLARLVREHWSIEAYHHRDTTFHEDSSRTGSGPANPATIRAAVIAAVKDAGYLHVPEGRRDHTTSAETLHLHGPD